MACNTLKDFQVYLDSCTGYGAAQLSEVLSIAMTLGLPDTPTALARIECARNGQNRTASPRRNLKQR